MELLSAKMLMINAPHIPKANVAKIPAKMKRRICVRGSRVLEPLTMFEGVDGDWSEVAVGCVGACVVLVGC
jgi:RNase P subunit RPR2